MEALAARIAAFCLQKHYIKPDQIAWLQYGLMRRLMGMVTFLLLLPVGAFFDGWGSTFLFLLVFRFIRMRTGGYHAKTPEGCLLGSTFTMIVSLELAKRLHPVCGIWPRSVKPTSGFHRCRKKQKSSWEQRNLSCLMPRLTGRGTTKR